MTAKEYLQEIKKLDIYINQKQIEFDALKKGRTYIPGMNYTTDKVQTSNGAGFTSISERLIDMQSTINDEIDRFHDIKHKKINQIQQLSRIEYSMILFKRYIQYQSFETISSELDRSYYWICHLHGEALKEFTEKFLETATNRK